MEERLQAEVFVGSKEAHSPVVLVQMDSGKEEDCTAVGWKPCFWLLHLHGVLGVVLGTHPQFWGEVEVSLYSCIHPQFLRWIEIEVSCKHKQWQQDWQQIPKAKVLLCMQLGDPGLALNPPLPSSSCSLVPKSQPRQHKVDHFDGVFRFATICQNDQPQPCLTNQILNFFWFSILWC